MADQLEKLPHPIAYYTYRNGPNDFNAVAGIDGQLTGILTGYVTRYAAEIAAEGLAQSIYYTARHLGVPCVIDNNGHKGDIYD